MALDPVASASFRCTIAPWLSVRNGAQAVDFYKSAFGATEVFRLDGPEGGVVARLSVEGAEFWVAMNLQNMATTARSLLVAALFEWS